MGEINICEAPAAYRRALRMGDAHKGKEAFDGKVDNEKEAKKAATVFNRSNEEECLDFLNYLGKKGFPLPEIKKGCVKQQLEPLLYTYLDLLKDPDDNIAKQGALLLCCMAGNWEHAHLCGLDLGEIEKEPVPVELKIWMINPLLKTLKRIDARWHAGSALRSLLASDIPRKHKDRILNYLIVGIRKGNRYLNDICLAILGDIAHKTDYFECDLATRARAEAAIKKYSKP